MSEAINAPTSVQAEAAEKAFDRLIATKATDSKKMNNFKEWWCRRRVRWQRWCRTDSSSSASSAEVANAKSISASGYRKRLLDVVTIDCSAAILEAAEIERQTTGLKTVGRGPSAAQCLEEQQANLLRDKEASADAVQYIADNANDVALSDSMQSIGVAQNAYRVNTSDTHRSDKRKRNQNNATAPTEERDAANKRQMKFFEKTVGGVSMDILECNSTMTKFEFHVLDTMGHLQRVALSKVATTCSSTGCKKTCHHFARITQSFPLKLKKLRKRQSVPLVSTQFHLGMSKPALRGPTGLSILIGLRGRFISVHGLNAFQNYQGTHLYNHITWVCVLVMTLN